MTEKQKTYHKKWRKENPEKISEYNKKWRKENPERAKENIRKWIKENPKQMKENNKKWRKENSETINKYFKNRKKNDIQFKLLCNLRTRLCNALKRNQKISSAIKELGCSIDYFKQYIENQFQEGMSWDNYNKHTWHLDHQIPLSIVDLTDKEQLLHVCHYTNLQPMWADKNISKGNKIIR